ncbi:acetoin utilization protein AcuC [Seohaeicola zhoushanensis]|uniref:Acetoin utilization protein AcuC n=1 Tax=Seohaeicola zhoushanensis TaxID=1569283 RepID=A0A8J3GY47_9RHOB|nr:acetoin utilization protein AcuC [Seohaeicola zhoushanensis]GHF56397.1 acetoin utilization protein AcuC [Seohaeicola zhoushanensis]
MTQPLFLGNDIYRGSTFGRAHPLAIPRVPTVMDLSRALGWLGPGNYRTSPRLRPAGLTAFHTPEYVAALQAAEASQSVSEEVRQRHGLGTLSNPIYPEMFRRPATGAGGALLAAELVAAGHTVYHPGGGTHHGMPDRANGFCYFNDPVLAILALRRRGLSRIAYVDIDAHHCDGVEAAFAEDPEVLLVSTHEEGRWPFTGALSDRGAGNVFNLPLPRDLNDDEFALALDQVILPAVAAHRPQVVVLQCGADAVEEDPLSRLALSNNAHWATVRALAALAPRFLVLGGGGYNPWSVGRLWTGVWATMNGFEIPEHLPPEAQAVLRALSWTRRAGRTPPPNWFDTLRDAPRTGAIRDSVRSRTAQLAGRLKVQV